MAKFNKLRVSLARDEPGDLLKAAEHTEGHRSRRDFLIAALGEPRTFIDNRNRVFGFDPIPMPDGYAGGFFKREKPIVAKHEDLKPYHAENYEAALFILSIEKDQIGWMENNGRLGAPRHIVESFFSHLTAKTDINDWRAVAHYMDSHGEYFAVVRERRAEIATLKFTFVPPNALGADDLVANFVKLVDGQAHPETQQHTYRAPPGKMDPEAPVMDASAKIAMAGGGEAEVKDGAGKVLYSSSRARTVEVVDDNELPTLEKPTFVRRVILRLFGQ